MARLLTKVRVALMVDHHGNTLDTRGDVTAKTLAAIRDQKIAAHAEIKRLNERLIHHQVKLACANAEIERLRALIVEHQEAAVEHLNASRRYRDAKALRYGAPHIIERCRNASNALEHEARQHSSVVDEHLRSLGQ